MLFYPASMKKDYKIFCFLLFFFFVPWPILFAQTTEKDLPDALLWKISGKNLKQPSYLFGTVHAICADDMIFTEGLVQALQNSQQLVLEIDITDKELPKKMENGMVMKGNSRLEELLPSEDYTLLSNYFQDSLGINIGGIQNMKPIFLTSLIYSKLLGCIPQSYENQLSTMASHQQMGISGIETIEEQIQVFEKISYKEQAEMLLQTIVEYPELADAYWNMIISYRNQDLNSLYHVITDIKIGMEKYEQLMVFDRNLKWIPRIEQMANLKPTLFAFGAAHLPGNKGVIALLKKRGYKVEPVLY